MIMRNLFSIALCGFLGLMMMAASCNTSKIATTSTSETTQVSETTETNDVSETQATESTSTAVNEGNEQELDKGMSVSPAQELASIKRTPCYGRCPMYRMTVLDNGQVVYEGKRFVEKIGTYSGLVSGEDVETILEMAKETNYFDLEDEYDVPVADFPTCVTSVTKDGKTKRVMNKQGAPASLKKFELYLDSLLEGLELTKLSDEVNY
ncbi:MAG: hypothetical protein ACI85F_002984 [Bacteroidia bacterium]|jgi:hypothetical protein